MIALRAFLVLGFGAILALMGMGKAQAAAEFCPATLVGELSPVDATSYRFRLGAISARAVSGTVQIQTANGWYAATFGNLPFRPLQQAYNDQGMTFSHEDFLSNDIVVKLPAVTSVLYAYVSLAQATGDKLMNWDRYGNVTCLPTPFSPKDKRNPKRPMPPLSSTPVRLTAQPIKPQTHAVCADPFEDVAIERPGPYHYPSMYGHDDPTGRPTGTSVIVAAVDAGGKLLDAWVWESAGTPLLDQSVLDEARKSTYKPGKAFCENVPGFFVLRSVFTQ